MKHPTYAGIGSRETPEDILDLMERIANKLHDEGFILRTGHAPGADQAFERGAGAQAEIYLPWATFEQNVGFIASRDPNNPVDIFYPTIFDKPTKEAYVHASNYHPNWPNLSGGAQALMARNSHQILGPDIHHPSLVNYVICWTPDGGPSGGTGQALRIAHDLDIPVWNLANEDDYDVAFDWVWGE